MSKCSTPVLSLQNYARISKIQNSLLNPILRLNLLKSNTVLSSADERNRTSTLLRAIGPKPIVYTVSPHPLVNILTDQMNLWTAAWWAWNSKESSKGSRLIIFPYLTSKAF